LPTRLDFFVKLKYESSAIIQSVDNKYSVCVTYFCGVINNARPAKWRYASHAVNGVSVHSGISSNQQAVNSIPKSSFRWRFMYKFLRFPYFLFSFFITILSYTLILPISQLQTQQLMTSQIRSYIEYLIRTYSIFCSFYNQNWWEI